MIYFNVQSLLRAQSFRPVKKKKGEVDLYKASKGTALEKTNESKNGDPSQTE